MMNTLAALVQISRDYLNELMEDGSVDIEVSFGNIDSIKFVSDGNRRFNMIVGENEYKFACGENTAEPIVEMLNIAEIESVSILNDGRLIVDVGGNLFSPHRTYRRK